MRFPPHARRAVFYPLQTFTKGRSVDFSQIPLFLETDDSPLRPALEAFARRLSHTVVWADSACRAKVHLAAVFACNFVNHMYAVGEGIVRSCGPALRRSQTAPGRDRRQGTRRRLPGRRADRPRRAQRPAHDGTPPCTARRRPPTRKHLLDNK